MFLYTSSCQFRANLLINKRLKYSKNRPLINKNDLNKTLVDLIQKREKFYNKADLVIKNETNINDSIENIIKEINQ